MLAGWVIALIFVPEYMENLISIKDKAFFALPHMGSEYKGITFDLRLIIPFLVISVSGSLKSFGNLLAAQRISEPELSKPDFVPIRKGLLADGFSTALSGLLGGMAVDTSSSNIGLAGSTKVVSRWVSVAAGVIFCILAFFPRLTTALSYIPKPVLGAAIIFAGCFMIITGFSEMFSQGWDQRMTFVVGISLFFGLSTAFLPEIYARANHLVQTFFTDPLPTTTLIAVILHQLFNLDSLFSKKK